MITIFVNGDPIDIADGSSILNVLEQLDMTQGRIAVELNASIVPRSQHATTRLDDGDTLEIVHAIGGG